MMKKLVVMAALIAVAGLQPGWAAEKKAARSAHSACPSASEAEAEQAIRFMTDVMVVSSTCQDTVYAEFRLRNQEPIRAYQKAMITHFHGNKAFDTWNTSLANQYAAKRAGLPSAQICQETAELMKTAQTLDPAGFRSYAQTQARAAVQTASCGK
jgi:hypothetical protein